MAPLGDPAAARRTKPSDTKASYGVTKTEQWMKLEAARKSFRGAMRRIEAAINEELHGINQKEPEPADVHAPQ